MAALSPGVWLVGDIKVCVPVKAQTGSLIPSALAS